MCKIAGGRNQIYVTDVHAGVKYKLISIITGMRGQGRGPRGQRALDAEGGRGRRLATADRRTRMLLTIVCYGIQEANTLPFPTVTGGWNMEIGGG
jgi:hypothetical protein